MWTRSVRPLRQTFTLEISRKEDGLPPYIARLCDGPGHSPFGFVWGKRQLRRMRIVFLARSNEKQAAMSGLPHAPSVKRGNNSRSMMATSSQYEQPQTCGATRQYLALSRQTRTDKYFQIDLNRFHSPSVKFHG
jgi:hypothetical protein